MHAALRACSDVGLPSRRPHVVRGGIGCCRPHVVGVAGEPTDLLSTGEVPQPDHGVVAAGQNMHSVGRELHSVHGAVVAVELPEEGAAVGVEHLHVGGRRLDTRGNSNMSLRCGSGPHLDDAALPASCQQLAVGSEAAAVGLVRKAAKSSLHRGAEAIVHRHLRRRRRPR